MLIHILVSLVVYDKVIIFVVEVDLYLKQYEFTHRLLHDTHDRSEDSHCFDLHSLLHYNKIVLPCLKSRLDHNLQEQLEDRTNIIYYLPIVIASYELSNLGTQLTFA